MRLDTRQENAYRGHLETFVWLSFIHAGGILLYIYINSIYQGSNDIQDVAISRLKMQRYRCGTVTVILLISFIDLTRKVSMANFPQCIVLFEKQKAQS